jgi:hypothetical protein
MLAETEALMALLIVLEAAAAVMEVQEQAAQPLHLDKATQVAMVLRHQRQGKL